MDLFKKARESLGRKLLGESKEVSLTQGNSLPVFPDEDESGFYAWSGEDLLNTKQFKPLVDDISTALGSKKEYFDKYLWPSLVQSALYYQLLPASEGINGKPVRDYGHHANAGGLLLHSLETMYFALNDSRLAFFNKGVNPAKRDHNLNVSRIACALAGLLHDVGKLQDPIITTYTLEDGKRIEHVYSFIESIPEFLARIHNLKLEDVLKDHQENPKLRPRYFIKGWNNNRDGLHEMLGPFLMRNFLSKATLRLLALDGNNHLLRDFMTAIDWDLFPESLKRGSPNIIAETLERADKTSSTKDTKTSSNSLKPLQVSFAERNAFLKTIKELEIQGQVAIDKADLNCFVFTHAQKIAKEDFVCFMRFDNQALGFFARWIKESNDQGHCDLLQGRAITLENMLKFFNACDLLLPSNREDTLYTILPNAFQGNENFTPFKAICFRQWQDLIDPNGLIYDRNQEAYRSVTCKFLDGDGPEKSPLLKELTNNLQDTCLGEINYQAVVYDGENLRLHEGTSSSSKPQINKPQEHIENSEPDNNDSTKKPQDLEDPESESEGERENERKNEKERGSEPSEFNDPACFEKQEENVNKETEHHEVDDIPQRDEDEGVNEKDEGQQERENESVNEGKKDSESETKKSILGITFTKDLELSQPSKKADENSPLKVDPDLVEQQKVPLIMSNLPAALIDDLNEVSDLVEKIVPKPSQETVDLRNFNATKAQFDEDRELLENKLSLESPDLSNQASLTQIESPYQDLSSPKEKALQALDELLNQFKEDERFALDLKIKIQAKLEGKFSYLEYVTIDGKTCFAAFLWNNAVKQNANAKQILKDLVDHNLIANAQEGQTLINQEIYYLGCVQLSFEITKIFVLSKLKPIKLTCRTEPYTDNPNKPPSAKYIIECFKYRLLSAQINEILFGYTVYGYASDDKGRYINAQALINCHKSFDGTGLTRLQHFLNVKNQKTPPYLIKRKNNVVLCFDVDRLDQDDEDQEGNNL